MSNYHFIGIGGIGMSGLARILLARGINVSGSDIAQGYVIEGLSKQGAKVYIGHAANNIPEKATVVYSTDIKPENPEYQAATELKLPILHRSDLLLQLMQPYKTLAVAGTHGKTTTSSLLASTLIKAGLSPSFAVGGIVQEYKTNASHGEGELFVAEADESDGTFHKYRPYGAIITNIGLDHMNHFLTEENLIHAFKFFASNVSSSKHLFWCGEDQRLSDLSLPGFQYGFHDKCDLQVTRYHQSKWALFLDIKFLGKTYSDVEIALIGDHNVLNASAVFGLALTLGASEELIREGLKSFKGVKRRCEHKPITKAVPLSYAEEDSQGITFIDDYAHHPTEIKTTLRGIKKAVGEKRLVVVYQPHRYSRIRDCLGTFSGVFQAADKVIITDIFSAGEKPIPGVTVQALMQEIQIDCNDKCEFIPRKELAAHLSSSLSQDDVIVSLGAGDITNLSQELSKLIQAPA